MIYFIVSSTSPCMLLQVFLALRDKLKGALLRALKSSLDRKQADEALVLWEVHIDDLLLSWPLLVIIVTSLLAAEMQNPTLR